MSAPDLGLVLRESETSAAPGAVMVRLVVSWGQLPVLALRPEAARRLAGHLLHDATQAEALLDAGDPQSREVPDGEGTGGEGTAAHGGTVSPPEPSSSGKGGRTFP